MNPSPPLYQPVCHSAFFMEHFFQDLHPTCMKQCPEHLLIFVYSGELWIEERENIISVKKDEYIFIRRNILVKFTKHSYQTEEFQSIFMGFSPGFLKNFRIKHNREIISRHTKTFQSNIIQLPYTPYLESLYISLLPYFECKCKPGKDLLELKLQEGVYCLLYADRKFYNCLFDFSSIYQ